MPMRLRPALLVAIATCLASGGLAFAANSDTTSDAAPDRATAAAPANPSATTAPSASAAAKPAAASGPDSPELQEIVVTGMRASLEKSLDIKKDASVVLDSINAEELGRFPDADVAASFRQAVVDVLVTRAMAAAAEIGATAVCLAGGVAANALLRSSTEEACAAAGIGAFLPSRALCTDNAAMVAAAGWWRLNHGDPSDLSLGADPNLRLVPTA